MVFRILAVNRSQGGVLLSTLHKIHIKEQRALSTPGALLWIGSGDPSVHTVIFMARILSPCVLAIKELNSLFKVVHDR